MIILGILQGIFEWLPVSSEGIVALAGYLFNIDNPIDTALFLHLGTLLAVLVYFRKDWLEIVTLKNKKLLRFLIITTIVSLIVAYPLYKLIKNIAIGNTLLLITGFALLITAYFQKRRLSINSNNLAFITGLLQGLAVIPGLSRSGSTVFGLSMGKISPLEILKTSYIISGPVVLASSIYIALNEPIIINTWPALISSFITGLISLYILLNIAKRINFFKFILAFGLICILGGIIGFLL